MNQNVLNFFRDRHLFLKEGLGVKPESPGKNLKRGIFLTLLSAGISLGGIAQTYTTRAAGSWSSASTWVNGVIPGATITASQTVVVKHKVQYSLNNDLVIAGTLNITGDSLKFDAAFTKKVTIQSTGVLNVSSGGFVQDVTADKSDFEMTGGRLTATDALISISKGMNASAGAKRTYTNSTIRVCGKYEYDGTSTLPPIDSIINSTVETALSKNGDYHLKSYAKLYVSNAKIAVGTTSNDGSFTADASARINVIPGATNNFGFNLLRAQKDLKNDAPWDARIDAYCVGGNVSGSKATDIDFTRPEDCSTTTTSAPAPELSFTNAVLKSGNDKKEGAVYRFSGITPGVDAEIKLKKFSRSDIVMNNIDNSVLGYNKAFQPEFGLPGVVQPYQNWYIDFELTFFTAGTNQKKKVQRADFTALDVDGDGWSIAEYASFNNPANIIYSTFSGLASTPAGSLGTSMTCPVCHVSSLLAQCLVCHGTGSVAGVDCATCNGNGVLYSGCNHPYEGMIGNVIQGPVQNYANIDTSGTPVMATFQYVDVDRITFRYGATSSAGTSNGSGIRLNSLWSKSFNLAPWALLPVKLTNFSVAYANNTANLKWEVVNGSDLSGFIVQRSTDGMNFTNVGTLPTTNASAYSYSDRNVASATGIVYYRVASVDKTKELVYSAVKVIRLAKDAALTLSTFPNPASTELRVTLPDAWQGKAVMLQLYSTTGVLMQTAQLSSAGQTETMALDGMAKGMYVVKATCGAAVAQSRIVKN